MFTRLPPGTVVPEWPGKSWDMVGDLVEQAGAQPNPNLVKFAANHPYVTAWVENESGADVTEFTPLKIKQPSFSYPDPIAGGEADESILNPQVLRVEEATSETPLDQLVFATQPIANNEAGLAIVFGVFPARVNIVSDSDTTCGVNPSELEKLKSGEGEIPIVWKPAGTGDKWCLVRLGGGGGSVTATSNIAVVTIEVPAGSAGGTIDAWDFSTTPSSGGTAILLVNGALPERLEVDDGNGGTTTESIADAKDRLQITVNNILPAKLVLESLIVLMSEGDIKPDSEWPGGAGDESRSPVYAMSLGALYELKGHQGYIEGEDQILFHESGHSKHDPFRFGGEECS